MYANQIGLFLHRVHQFHCGKRQCAERPQNVHIWITNMGVSLVLHKYTRTGYMLERETAVFERESGRIQPRETKYHWTRLPRISLL